MFLLSTKTASKSHPKALQTSTLFVFPVTQQHERRLFSYKNLQHLPRVPGQPTCPIISPPRKKILSPVIDAGASRGSSQGRRLRASCRSMAPRGDLSAPAFLSRPCLVALVQRDQTCRTWLRDGESWFFVCGGDVILDLRMNGNGVVGTSLICRRVSLPDTYPGPSAS